MHIPDGFLDTKTWVAFDVISAAGVGYALRRVKSDLDDSSIPAMGVAAAFIFAAQMLNFPIPGGTSGHLIGGVLAAVLLGPWMAIPVMTAVIVVQALIFQDGGITALGANVFNMGIVPSLVGSIVRSVAGPKKSKRGTFLFMTFVASWVSVELAAASCSLQLAASNLIPLSLVMTAMLSYHALIGIGEGLGTCLVFSFLLKTRPDILTESLRSSAWKKNDVLFLGIGVAVFLVWFVLPFASSQPDGLEKVASEKGFQQSITELFHSVLPNYALPGVSNSWLASTIAALAGIGVILTVALIIRRLVRAKK